MQRVLQLVIESCFVLNEFGFIAQLALLFDGPVELLSNGGGARGAGLDARLQSTSGLHGSICRRQVAPMARQRAEGGSSSAGDLRLKFALALHRLASHLNCRVHRISDVARRHDRTPRVILRHRYLSQLLKHQARLWVLAWQIVKVQLLPHHRSDLLLSVHHLLGDRVVRIRRRQRVDAILRERRRLRLFLVRQHGRLFVVQELIDVSAARARALSNEGLRLRLPWPGRQAARLPLLHLLLTGQPVRISLLLVQVRQMLQVPAHPPSQLVEAEVLRVALLHLRSADRYQALVQSDVRNVQIQRFE